jgi:predicted RecA/RadA family phage recombinase
MAGYVEGRTRTFTAGAAIGKHVAVKLSTGKLAAAGLAEEFVGFLDDESFADGDVRSVTLRQAPGTVLAKASNTFSAGAVLYVRASGLVDDIATSSAVRVGIALEAATAANDIVEVLPC